MKYLTMIPKTARRTAAVIAAVSAAGLIATSAAVAAGSPGAALAADTSRAAPAAVRACTADDLGVWVAVAQLDGAAGSVYYPLQFTNLSRHACAMRGFPGVSAVDRNLHQLGSPAGRDSRGPGPDRGTGPGGERRTPSCGTATSRCPPHLAATRPSGRSSCGSTHLASTTRPTPPSTARPARTPGPSTWMSGRSRPAWARESDRYEPAGSSTNTGISRVVRCWYSAYGG